ncbi:MAG: ribonuclease P protein component [Aquiluna sp.]|nr:ribonuclease P protein component [Aquiluna sp.]MCF8545698.1 ribonuclease P protein component [Aquiluna sp.]
MLPRDNRLSSGDDIRDVVKNGRRVSNSLLTLHFVRSEEPKFAIIVSKAIGNAVQRNLVKRRARAALKILMSPSHPKLRAVLRMRPESSAANWDQLSEAISEIVNRASR